MNTRRVQFGVVGNPIAQSRSPQIHTAFAAQFAIADFAYERFAVEPTEFKSFVDHHFFEPELDGLALGLNITVPFKTQALEWAKEHAADISPRAFIAGAVNTLGWTVSRGLFADNTDGVGLVTDLTNRWHFDLSQKRVLVMGAGGATRGIILPLLEAEVASIDITNRSADKAADLVQELGRAKVQALDWDSVLEATENPKDRLYNPQSCFDLVINATSAGLTGQTFCIAQSIAKQAQVAYDLSYATTPTRFLQSMSSFGCRQCVDGLGMLVEQAAQSFRQWHGLVPTTQAVFASLR